MKFISLFAGIGGFDLALTREGHECVYANEWDKYAAQIYDKHFKTKIDTKDIRTVKAEEIPDHDLLVGGFPCQSFSIAGKRKGFKDTRGTLFFEIARIIKQKQPRLLLLENVKGLLSHDKGSTFATIISTLDELGYDCQWQVLNSKNFGVPQNRERVFIIGHLRGTPRPKVFPIREAKIESIKTKKFPEPISNCLRTNYSNGHSNETYIRQLNNPTHSNNRIYGDVGISPALNTMQGENRQPKVVIPVLSPDRANKRQNGRRFKTDGEPSFTLTGQDRHGIMISDKTKPKIVPMRWVRTEKGKEYRRNAQKNGKDLTPFNDGYRELVESKENVTGCLTNALQKDALIKQSTKIRRLTPLEYERLQGFPDNWTEGISDTQRYKCCGNAVTVNVVQHIIRLIGE